MRTFRLEWTTVGLISVAAVAATVSPASSGVIRIVVPPSFEDVEGSGSVSPATGLTRIQYLVPASGFAGLPDTHRLIVAWNFRSDITQSEPLNWTLDGEQIWMSTTNLSNLTSVFADNHGPNKTLVHNGTMIYPLLATGPPQGPRDFADGTRLHTPFFYDPSEGNLLIERLTFDLAGPTIDNHPIAGATVLLSPDTNSTTGMLFGVENIAQFEFVPEPSTFVLTGLALACLLAWRRKVGHRCGRGYYGNPEKLSC